MTAIYDGRTHLCHFWTVYPYVDEYNHVKANIGYMIIIFTLFTKYVLWRPMWGSRSYMSLHEITIVSTSYQAHHCLFYITFFLLIHSLALSLPLACLLFCVCYFVCCSHAISCHFNVWSLTHTQWFGGASKFHIKMVPSQINHCSMQKGIVYAYTRQQFNWRFRSLGRCSRSEQIFELIPCV